MYVPNHFACNDPEVLRGLIREHSFAALVTAGENGPVATHIPLLLDPSGETLLGHLARANPHWKSFDGRPLLAIFSGPHAYISPRWYVSLPNVPTWNYVAVHATGVPTLVDDGEAAAIVRRTVEVYDPQYPLDEAYLAKLLPGIVAFRMPITKLEGKLKLSQNKSAEDRDSVMRLLDASGDDISGAVSALMRIHSLE